MVTVTLNGRAVSVEAGTTIAAAILNAGPNVIRRSVTGAGRGPVCGMGICFECRVTVDGVRHRRSCMLSVSEGMNIVFDEA